MTRAAVLAKWAGSAPAPKPTPLPGKGPDDYARLRRYTDQRAAKVARFDSGSGVFSGIAVAYNVVDEYRSVFLPGCFDESLAQRMPAICWSHAWNDPVGIVTGWDSLAEGLAIVAQLDDPDAVPRARQAWAQLRSGSMTDLSVGFSHVERREPTPDELQRFPGCGEIIERAQLDEVSIVMRGAVPGSQVTGTRAGNAASAAGLRGAGIARAAVAPRVSGWRRPGALVAEAERRRKARNVQVRP